MSSEYTIDVAINTASFVGQCPRCKEPSVGGYDADEDDGGCVMKCVNCGFRVKFSIKHEDNSFEFPAEDME